MRTRLTRIADVEDGRDEERIEQSLQEVLGRMGTDEKLALLVFARELTDPGTACRMLYDDAERALGIA